MNAPTNISARKQSAFDRALAEYLRAREALDATPVDTTSSEDELLAMDAIAAAERRLFQQTPKDLADVRALAEIAFTDPDSIPGMDLIGAVLNGIRQFDHEPSRIFNPGRWIEQFKRSGGGWVVTDDQVALLSPVPQTDAIESLLWELRTRGGEEQVKLIIRETEPVASPTRISTTRAQWEHIQRRYEVETARMAENEGNPYQGTVDDPECEKAEALTAQIVEAYDAVAEELLRFPAPDAGALRFKLALMACDHFGAFNSRHSREFAQVIAADAARLLAGEA